MRGGESLTGEDRAFGKAVLGLGLVTREKLTACAALIADDVEAGRSQRPLPEILLARGDLTEEQVEEVRAAARREPRPKRGSAHLKAVRPEDLLPSGQNAGDRDAALRKVIAKIAPGRIYLEMLEYIVKHEVSIVDVNELTAALSEDREDVIRALKRWVKAGIMRRVGDFPYGYSPIPRRQKDIELLMSAWHDPRRHAHVLSCALDCE